MCLTVAFLIAFLPIFMTVCLPISAQWSPDIEFASSHCRAIQSEEFASVAANMVLDLLIVAIPIPSVCALQMALGKKLFVTSMFSLELAVVGIGAWRIYTTAESTKSLDWSWFIVTIALQSHLELWLDIIAANLPLMSPLMTRFAFPAVSKFIRSFASSKYSMSRSDSQSELYRPSGEMLGKSRRKFSQIGEATTETGSMEIPLGTIERHNDSDIEMGHDLPKPEIWRQVEVSVNHD
ncbi:hypothetical protein BCON_0024g00070 [Botryotinia convoluta]|uniref:Rhodopsin domain-containing protein n=1 Tax=Botryotinia convoluta TaxID=54673 RepID=A0A4Z1IYX7_9HELO|nr:hypothetical protein BCON_0024g00070 [Botryotinia convoluta]